MINPSNYFNLYDVFVNELFGSAWIFIIVSFLILVVILTSFRISYSTTSALLLLFGLVLYGSMPTVAFGIYVIIILVIGLSFYKYVAY
jgi:hypothetical protein